VLLGAHEIYLLCCSLAYEKYLLCFSVVMRDIFSVLLTVFSAYEGYTKTGNQTLFRTLVKLEKLPF